MLKVDSSSKGTWKPHFFDEVLFVGMFKLGNLTWGILKLFFFFDKSQYVGLFKLDNMTWVTWKSYLSARAWLVKMFKLDNNIWRTWKSSFLLKQKSRLCLILLSLSWCLYFLKSLTCFDLNECLRVRTLHGRLKNLTPLTFLWLFGCLSLTTLLEGLESCISLRNL